MNTKHKHALPRNMITKSVAHGAYTLIAHPDSRQTIHAHIHHTNGTHAQIAHKRYVRTDITQTIRTHRYHTNGTYTQISCANGTYTPI